MKKKIFIIVFNAILVFFLLGSIFSKKEEISYSERRKLTTFPKYELTTDYANKLEKYLLDHFFMRDILRSIKANFNYYVLQKKLNNDMYLKDEYIFKSIYPLDQSSLDNYKNYVDFIKNLTSENNNIYMVIVPDKNYFLQNELFLNIDYEKMYKELENTNVNFIDIRDLLSLDSYYKTDTHWKQENLESVVDKILNGMNVETVKIEYKQNMYDKFYGVYYGSSAIKGKAEKIVYLTNEVLDSAYVNYFENKDLHSIYNVNNLSNLDSYDVYLDGATSFIEIENEKALTNRELVIFRDSFGSSISPLFVPYYKKITIIDNRYISSKYFKEMINFTNQDVLILNSTLLVNKSNTLKK